MQEVRGSSPLISMNKRLPLGSLFYFKQYLFHQNERFMKQLQVVQSLVVVEVEVNTRNGGSGHDRCRRYSHFQYSRCPHSIHEAKMGCLMEIG